jgi:hypothetical protein
MSLKRTNKNSKILKIREIKKINYLLEMHLLPFILQLILIWNIKKVSHSSILITWTMTIFYNSFKFLLKTSLKINRVSQRIKNKWIFKKMNGCKHKVSKEESLKFIKKLDRTKSFYKIKKNIIKWLLKLSKDIHLNFKKLFNRKSC